MSGQARPEARAVTIGDWFERSLAVNHRRVAVDDAAGQTLTYRDIDRWSAAAAAFIAGQGVRAGDTVAILTGNAVEFIVCDIAVARLGAVKLPVNELLPAATIGYMLDHSGAAMLISAPQTAALAAQAIAHVAAVPRSVAVASKGAGASNGGTAATLPTLQDALAGDFHTQAVDWRQGLGPDEPAALYYTGGTTGRPKGVVHTQASTVAFHQAQMLEAEIRQQDRLLLMTPLAHAAGLFAQTALLRGATVVLRRGFDAEAAVQAMESAHITWTFLVPTMIYRLLEVLRDRPARPLEIDTIVYGAAPISPTRLTEAIDRFGQVFLQLYGQTECPNWGTRLVKLDHDPDRPELLSSCGQASIHVEVRVVDDDGAIVPAGTVGEICLRSPYLLARYHGDPLATEEKFVDGFIRTGDIGLIDDDGYVFLKDRRADMVISGGMNVYCKEVEEVLSAHPTVSAVAVIGIPHADWGEAVHAEVVAGSGFDPEELLAWARGRLPAYARPRSVHVAERLPETPFGKIDKKRLRAPYWEGRERAIN